MTSNTKWQIVPIRQLTKLMFIILLAEGGIHFLLNKAPIVLPIEVQIVINVMLLSAVIFPLLYSQILAPMLQEIAERRVAESALRSSELHYRLVIDNIFDVIIETDNTLTITFLTPSIEGLSGYASFEVVGTNMMQYLTNESQNRTTEIVAEVLAENQLSSQKTVVKFGEFQIICKDGSLKWVEVKTTFIFTKDGLERFVGVMRDIDSRKKVESELTDAYTLLDKTFSSLNEAVFIVSSQTRTITRVNSTAEKMFGYTTAELVGSSTSILHLNNDMYSRFGEKIRSDYAECGYMETIFQMKRKDGSIFDSEHLVTPIKSDSGVYTSHVCVVRDISRRVSIEEDLAILVQEVETRNRFVESVITNLQSGIIVVDLDFRVTMVNNYVSEICRIPINRFLRSNLADISPELYEKVLAGRTVDELLATFFTVKTVIGYSLFDQLNAEGKIIGYIINFKDLTEIVRIRKELRMKERLSAMGEVVARVAHEMRNPLFGMTAAAQILEMELKLEANQQELMDSLLKESHRLNNLVEELLDTTRETLIKKARINLVRVLDESVRAVESEFHEKRVSVHRNYDGEVWVSADFEKLEQVIINLVKNAMEASRPGEDININVSHDEKGIAVTVADNGEGIPDENLYRIFDVFYTTKKNGTGMGLSICKGIVDAHGGSLTASNNPDGGAKFIMQLPFGDSPA